jgi:hypothetical protein
MGPMRRFPILLIMLMVGGLAPQGAVADDTSSGVTLPTMRSDPPGRVAVTDASADLRDGKLTLRLMLRVSDGPLVRLMLDGPRFGWMGESEPYPDRQFPELQVTLDDAPARMEDGFAAWVGNRDVTGLLRDAHVDPFAIAATPPFVTVNPQAAAPLVAAGAVEKSDGDYLAKWTAERRLVIALGGGGEHRLTVRYAARPGYALRSFASLGAAGTLGPVCLTAQALAPRLGNPPAGRSFVLWPDAVPLGIDGKPPVRAALTVGPAAPPEQPRLLTAFCGADGKPVIAATEQTAAARTDAKGVLHIMTISAMAKP